MFSPSARSEAQYFEDLCPWKKQFLMSTSADVPPRSEAQSSERLCPWKKQFLTNASADVPPRPMTENKKMPADFATEICRHLLLLTLY